MRGARLHVVATIWVGSFFLAFDRVNISLAAPGIMHDVSTATFFDGELACGGRV